MATSNSNRREKIGPWRTARRIAGEILVATFLFYAVVNVSAKINDSDQAAVPAEAWFRVNEVYVPDFHEGENPKIIYDRQVIEPFRGFYVVEVQKQLNNGLWWSACSGSGVSDYEVGEAIPQNTVRWDWYISRPCHVEPGTYRLRSSWELRRPGWPAKQLINLSNEFHVFPKRGSSSQSTPATTGRPGLHAPKHSAGN